MNVVELQKKLLAAARANRPSEAVPYAFEKRILARLTSLPMEDPWRAWGVALWRGALASVAVALLAGAWAVSPLNTTRSNSTDFSQELEQTLMTSVDEVDS